MTELFGYGLFYLIFIVGIIAIGNSVVLFKLNRKVEQLRAAQQLVGLYRVFSFLGLGVTLLALSWFYTRFVFAR